MDKIHRRQFLGHSSKAAAALCLPSWLGCQPKQPATAEQKNSGSTSNGKQRKIGVALLGLGYYSSELLAPALQWTKHCELRGIITGSPEKIAPWQARYGIADRHVYSYETLHEIANDEAIDVVYVVTPTATHARFAIAAAQAGKHVWCEKPMAMSVDECQAIIAACKSNRVQLAIGYRMQHEPNTQTVIGYATTQPFGTLQAARAEAGFAGGIPTTGWRAMPEMGGGALYDMGVYTINALRYATGMEPLQVLQASSHFPSTVDVTTTYQLAFPNGLIAQGKTSIVESCNLLRLEATHGWYELSPMQAYTGVEGRTSSGEALNIPIHNQQAQQMDDDALAILQNTAVLVPGENAMADIHIVQAIQQAAQLGKAVDL